MGEIVLYPINILPILSIESAGWYALLKRAIPDFDFMAASI